MRFRRELLCLISVVCIATATARAAERDDLLWLEAPKSERALDWAREQSRETKDRLSALPIYGGIAKELDTVLKQSTPSPEITLLGAKAVRLLRDAEELRHVREAFRQLRARREQFVLQHSRIMRRTASARESHLSSGAARSTLYGAPPRAHFRPSVAAARR